MAADDGVAKAAGKAGAVDIALGLVTTNVTQIRTHATLRFALKFLGNLVASPSNIARFVNRQASDSHLDLGRVPYGVYGVK